MKKDYYAALDYLLKRLKEIESETPLHHFDPEALRLRLAGEIAGKFGIEHWEHLTMLEELTNNNYVNKDLKLSFKGLTFILDGGYTKARERLITSANLQSLQTWVIALGTGLAGLYAFYQFCAVFFPCCSCCHH